MVYVARNSGSYLSQIPYLPVGACTEIFVFCMRPAGRPREVGISEHDAIFGNAHLLWLFRLGKRREAAQMSWNVQKWHLSFQGGVRGLDFGDFFQIQQRCSIENASINSENAQEFPHVWLSDNVTHTRMYAYQRVIVNYIILNERRLFLSQILNTTDELPADWGYMLRWTQHFSKKKHILYFLFKCIYHNTRVLQALCKVIIY